jgi:cellobiose phosphorylase
MKYLQAYSRRRLLGDHVPYPVEAYPEGDQAHLSAESALYCRIITEGMFGIEPKGFRSFTMTPRLPDGWNSMTLRDVKAFGGPFDIEVNRDGQRVAVIVRKGGQTVLEKLTAPGESLSVELSP